MRIGFSFDYLKLHGQRSATLVRVDRVRRDQLDDSFIDYDTRHADGHFTLEGDEFYLLYFIGEKLIPFTTLRLVTDQNRERFEGNVGHVFELFIVNA